MPACIPITIAGIRHCIPIYILTRPRFQWPPDPDPVFNTDNSQPDPLAAALGLKPEVMLHLAALAAVEQVVSHLPRELQGDFHTVVVKQMAELARAGVPVQA